MVDIEIKIEENINSIQLHVIEFLLYHQEGKGFVVCEELKLPTIHIIPAIQYRCDHGQQFTPCGSVILLRGIQGFGPKFDVPRLLRVRILLV